MSMSARIRMFCNFMIRFPPDEEAAMSITDSPSSPHSSSLIICSLNHKCSILSIHSCRQPIVFGLLHLCIFKKVVTKWSHKKRSADVQISRAGRKELLRTHSLILACKLPGRNYSPDYYISCPTRIPESPTDMRSRGMRLNGVVGLGRRLLHDSNRSVDKRAITFC